MTDLHPNHSTSNPYHPANATNDSVPVHPGQSMLPYAIGPPANSLRCCSDHQMVTGSFVIPASSQNPHTTNAKLLTSGIIHPKSNGHVDNASSVANNNLMNRGRITEAVNPPTNYLTSIQQQQQQQQHMFGTSNLAPHHHGMVEYIPAMYSTNMPCPSTAVSSTMFGPFGQPTTILPEHQAFVNSRGVRHNTSSTMTTTTALGTMMDDGKKVKFDSKLIYPVDFHQPPMMPDSATYLNAYSNPYVMDHQYHHHQQQQQQHQREHGNLITADMSSDNRSASLPTSIYHRLNDTNTNSIAGTTPNTNYYHHHVPAGLQPPACPQSGLIIPNGLPSRAPPPPHIAQMQPPQLSNTTNHSSRPFYDYSTGFMDHHHHQQQQQQHQHQYLSKPRRGFKTNKNTTSWKVKPSTYAKFPVATRSTEMQLPWNETVASNKPLVDGCWNAVQHETFLVSLKMGGFRHILDSCPTRILLSTSLVGSVIGRSGRTIRAITAKTGVKILLKHIVAFSQFSVPGKVGATGTAAVKKAAKPDDESVVDDDGDSNDAQVAAAKESSVLTVQSDQSQVVLLYGSREQCSMAVMEILAICFKESKYRNFSNPCLGLLMDKSVYLYFSMASGGGGGKNGSRKYFDAIQNATGARISVTNSSLPNPDASIDDRVVVIRGSLDSINQAEMHLSEQLRWATIESLIPTHLWPVLNWLNPLSSNLIATSSPSSSKRPPLYDPAVISSLIESMANVFWPHLVRVKLHRMIANRQRLQQGGDKPVGKSGEEVECDDGGGGGGGVQKEDGDETKMENGDTDPVESLPIDRALEQLAISERDQQQDCNTQLVIATAIQDALVRAIGPSVWLATGSVVFMRVSYSDAGALIGSEGNKIKQLIQSTGAQVHIGKTPIAQPFALDLLTNNESAGIHPINKSDESHVDTPSSHSDDAEDNAVDAEGEEEEEEVHVVVDEDCEEQPPLESVDEQVVKNETASTATAPADDGGGAGAVNLPSSSPFRLLTLSGPIQAQIAAQWQIFQRLRSIHSRQQQQQQSTTAMSKEILMDDELYGRVFLNYGGEQSSCT